MRKEKRQDTGRRLDKRTARAYLLHVAKTIQTPGRPKAIGYVRVSSRKQADEGASLEVQREALIRHAVFSGFDLLRVETDGGISGGKGEEKRPGLAAVLEAVRSGEASVVLVKHADRLSRDTELAYYLRHEVRKAGGRIEILDEVKNDRVRLAIDIMIAEIEKVRGSERMRGFLAARKAKGLLPGFAPFGMRRAADGRLEADPEAAATVARIVRMRAQGASLRAIAAALNADHTPGRTWNQETVRGVVKRSSGGTP